jgi:hypothetical protein
MQSNPQPKLSEREIAEAWTKITVQLWRKNLTRMKIGQNSSGDLYQSFKYKVIAGSRGNVDRIDFDFNYYEKFLGINNTQMSLTRYNFDRNKHSISDGL